MLNSKHVVQLRKSHDRFYCPNGHGISYGESDCDKTKAELEKTKDQLNNAYEQNSELRRQTWELKAQLLNARKVPCPHCKKRFVNLKRHIQKNHA